MPELTDLFLEEVSTLDFGKKTPTAVYIHDSLVPKLPRRLNSLISKLDNQYSPQISWNIVKLFLREPKLSFLSYPDFDSESYPELKASLLVDLSESKVKLRSYEEMANKPILHRKELFVDETYPLHSDFAEITKEGEVAGLYENSSEIGFSESWQFHIRQKGYSLVDGRLFRSASLGEGVINRERTAISRSQFSSPFQILDQVGLVNDQFSYLDYGCGLGGDASILESLGLLVSAWDPNHRPEGELVARDIVNLGFVINVIEDREERADALLKAYALSKKLLVISAMIASEAHILKFQPYKDGVITSRNTFQKYYSQEDLRGYIRDVIDKDPVPMGQGVFGIFSDPALEFLYFQNKFRARGKDRVVRRMLSDPERKKILVNDNLEELISYWNRCLERGHLASKKSDVGSEKLLSVFKTVSRVNAIILEEFDEAELFQSQRRRREELILVFSILRFSGKIIFKQLSPEQQSAVRSHFSNVTELNEAIEEQFSKLTDTSQIEQLAVEWSEEEGVGFVEEGKSLTFHKTFYSSLPLTLKLYVSCAEQLYSDFDVIQLIKIHFHTGKVSFMGYDNFSSSPIPMLRERIKVELWSQNVRFYDYIYEHTPKPLYLKSLFQDVSFEDYSKQKAFDERLKLYGYAPTTPHFGPAKAELDRLLRRDGLQIKGYRFHRARES